MHLITKRFAGAPPSSRSLRVKPRSFASETHRLKESLIDSLASARDALAALVFFFCANTAVDVTTLTASAAATVANMSRIALLPGTMNRCITISSLVWIERLSTMQEETAHIEMCWHNIFWFSCRSAKAAAKVQGHAERQGAATRLPSFRRIDRRQLFFHLSKLVVTPAYRASDFFRQVAALTASKWRFNVSL
jgi:hypothetical protein